MFRRDALGRVLAENRLKALREACDIPIDPSMPQTPRGAYTRSDAGPTVSGLETFSGTLWQSIGPQPIQSLAEADRAWGRVAGRVDAIAIDPANPSTLLLGAATGGIWKSTDAGATWRPVSDTAPSLSTSSIAFSPFNPSIVFATTGELDRAGFETSASYSLGTYLGAGLLKSIDGGETWVRIDVDLPPNAVLARVLVHPANPQSVLVAVHTYFTLSGDYYYGGIYRSVDGGVHFSLTKSHVATDLAQDPNDPDTAYFAAENSNCSGCPNGGVWVTHDFGQTWAEMFTNSSPVKNVKLGVSNVAPTALFASFLNADQEHTGAGGIFWSPDAGAHWSRVSADPGMCPAPPASNQCDYDHWIQPDPANPQIVYFGSIDLYKSSNGGGSWQKLTHNYDTPMTAVPVHPDQHAVAIVPSAPSTLYFGNDGGIYRSLNGGVTFQNLNGTLALSQFNNVVPHPTKANEAIGGTQDNGNLRFTGSLLWADQTSGDGGLNLIRRDAPAQSLVGFYYGFMDFSSSEGSAYQDVTACGTLMDCTKGKPLASEPMAFYPPAVAAPSSPSTVFFGTNRVWKNTTFGANKAAWTPMSAGAITTGSGVLTALEVAADGSGAIWAGSSSGDVLFSSNGGATFSSRRSGLPDAILTKVVAATSDGSEAYATFGGFLGSPSRHVFQTTDGGLSWVNISGNLPDVPVTSLVIDPTDRGDLFVGTDVGVFRSVNGGASWTSFNQGLPNVSVYALAFSPATQDLYAATYGRGVYRIGNPNGSPLPNLTPYQPSGWSDKIVVAKAPGGTTDSAGLKSTDSLYVNWAVANTGTAATTVRFYTNLFIDGTLRQSWYDDPPLGPGYYGFATDFSIGSLPNGSHTIQIVADPTNVIAESSESDNQYTKTIVVGTLPLPSAGFTLSGASLDQATGDYDGLVGEPITFTAAETHASSYGWDFGDGTLGSGKVVTKSYSSAGPQTVRLLVYGDGVATATGPAIATTNLDITDCFHCPQVVGFR
jgi:photosystem II stability/assembly factor-like uncharacterized protein